MAIIAAPCTRNHHLDDEKVVMNSNNKDKEKRVDDRDRGLRSADVSLECG